MKISSAAAKYCLIAICLLSISARDARSQTGNAGLPSGFVGPRSDNGLAPVTLVPVQSPEITAHQQIREQALTAMEQKLKIGGGFQTAKEAVAQKVGTVAGVDTSIIAGLAPELARLANAAKQLAALKNAIDLRTPPSVDQITAIINEFETALLAVKQVKDQVGGPDKLAASLLKLAITTLDTTNLSAGGLLPALMTNFLGQLGLNGIFGDAAPQALPLNPSASQVVFNQILTDKKLATTVAALKK